jgi:hypothetical protein
MANSTGTPEPLSVILPLTMPVWENENRTVLSAKLSRNSFFIAMTFRGLATVYFFFFFVEDFFVELFLVAGAFPVFFFGFSGFKNAATAFNSSCKLIANYFYEQ